MGKQCRKCSVDLVVGENIKPGRYKNYDYQCSLCQGKSFKKWVSNNKDYWKKFIRKNESYKHSIKPGVYGIFSDCKLIYIGESKVPYHRKSDHFSLQGKRGGVSNITCIAKALTEGELQRDKLRFKMLELIDDTEARKQREMCLIQRYKPLYNEVYV